MYQQNERIMTITKKIENLKNKINLARTNSEVNKLEKQILKLAKIYNRNNYKDMYLIVDNQVYGLQWRENHLL